MRCMRYGCGANLHHQNAPLCNGRRCGAALGAPNVETRRATFVQAAKAGIVAVIVGVETKPLPNR